MLPSCSLQRDRQSASGKRQIISTRLLHERRAPTAGWGAAGSKRVVRPALGHYISQMDMKVDANRALADRLRLERAARGWSLAEVAERSGVSKAMIRKVELGAASPTAALLVRLAGAFDLTLAGLLLRAEGQGGRLSRAADQPLWTDPASGYVRRQILAIPDQPIELIEVELPARKEVALPRSSYALIRQAVWMQAGTLTLTEGGDRYQLQPGDCLAFGPPSDVTFANETDAPCRYVVALDRR
jgi:transcriptional regulator with XRE-family HTH domain